MKLSTSLLVANSASVALAYEAASMVAVSNVEGTVIEATATSNPLVAVSNVEGTVIEATATGNSLVAVSNVEGDSNVASADDGYAVPPSTTIVTTDALGRTTTEALWYLPAVASSVIAATDLTFLSTATPTEYVNSIASDTSAVELDSSLLSQSSKNILSSATKDSTETESTSKTRNWDDALTTVTTTNSDGSLYTSKVWWLPSSTEIASEEDSDEKYATSFSKYKTTYTTHSGSELETVTTTLSSRIVYKAVTNSSSTHSIKSNSTNAAFKNEHCFGAGVGAVALAALLL